ncbi:MAG: PHP domain-containing protein [Sedimenticolaceae bacterium]
MSLIYDLHAHSTASDGTLSPAELMQFAHAAGVNVMALTDHDTTAGIAEARDAATHLGMEFIPGIELSVTWNNRTVHIVGLGIDEHSEPMQAGIKKLMDFRQWRAEEIGRRLEKAGYPDMYEKAKAYSNGCLIGRVHFARALVAAGHADTVGAVFKKFLVGGKPGFVPGAWAELSDVVKWIREAGGRAIIAHPARYDMTRTKLRQLITDFKELGGEGFEVCSGSHSKDDVNAMAQHARDFGLLASAGSDFHGPENPWVNLGQLAPIPKGLKPVWHDWH